MKDLCGKFCKEPFTFLYIDVNGNASLCCPTYTKFTIGNVFESNDIDSIWNSTTAKVIRKSVCDGSFSYCNDYCGLKASGNLPRIDECNEEWQKLITNPMKKLNFLPAKIQFAYDRTCNIKCVFCRSEVYHSDEFELKKFDKVKDKILKPLLKNADILQISGSGEVFASKHSIKYFEELNPEEYPKLRYYLFTNGILFTEENWNRYPFFRRMVHTVNVSIDATKKETYQKIRRGGNWDLLISNLHFISQLRRDQKIKDFELHFIVTRDNYREMVPYIQFGLELDVDCISFGRVEGPYLHSKEEFINMDICDVQNKEHHQFLEVLKDPLFRNSRVWLGNISPYCKVEMDEIK